MRWRWSGHDGEGRSAPGIGRRGPLIGLGMLLLAASARAAVLHVGAGHRFGLPSQAIAAAHPGDTVAIDPGNYRDCAVVRAARLTILGTKPGVVMGGVSCDGKGVLVIDAPGVTVRNLTLRGAAVADGNGAGIRAEGGDLTVVDLRLIDDQNGILDTSGPTAVLRVSGSLFRHDGTCISAGGCSHGLYAGPIARLVVTHSRFLDIRSGHGIKSRAAATVVRGCTIADGQQGTSSYLIDVPNGGDVRITGNRLEKGPLTQNPGTAIAIGEEGVTHPTRRILVQGNVFRNDVGLRTVFVRNETRTKAVLRDNRFSGGPVMALAGR